MHSAGEDDGRLSGPTATRPGQSDGFTYSQDSVWRKRVETPAEPFRFGRFTVLGPLGGGGMGTVFVAYDPDLDRKIALKVLHMRGERGRRDVLREGRALARLKHPNVVTVYEVGVVDDRVFVAMEYVVGQSLREWLREPRTSDAILVRLVEAGRGLAAAHAVGLIHRDFKPENVVVESEGCVRVIDFGLARPIDELTLPTRSVSDDPSATTLSSLVGTPAYMPPERRAGAPGDACSDQYSFCVTAWEALLGARPPTERPDQNLPTWLRHALARGLAAEPARRWPSMAALLATLERGRTYRRMRAAAVLLAGVAALTGAAEGHRRWDLARRQQAHVEELRRHVDVCETAGAAVDAVWNDAARRRLLAAFTATGLRNADAVAVRVTPWLDRKAERWKRARTDACLYADPVVGGRWSADTLDRAVLCLEDRRTALEGLVDAFARANARILEEALTIASGPGDIDDCMDVALLQRRPVPPQNGREVVREVREALSRAAGHAHAGDFAAALRASIAARERAERGIRWPPLWAAAREREGVYLEKTGAFAEAEVASAEAYFAAARSQTWDVAADAATALIYVVGYKQARFAEGRAWARHAETAIKLAGVREDELTANLLNRVAAVQLAARENEAARGSLERFLAIQERRLGPDHVLVALGLNNLGNLYQEAGSYAQAQVLFERALEIRERTLGPVHADVATSLNSLAHMRLAVGAHAEARALHERSLAVYEAAVGPEHPDYGMALGNLANTYEVSGDYVTAQGMQERALAIQERALGPRHPEVTGTMNNLGNVYKRLKQYDKARALFERALAGLDPTTADRNPHVAVFLNNLGDMYESMGETELAKTYYTRAIAGFEQTLGRDHPLVAVSLWGLGNLQVDAGEPRDALPSLERAAAIVDAHEGVQNSEFDIHFGLARALVGAHGDRGRALAAARKAHEGLRNAGAEQAGAAARVEAWLTQHDPAAKPPRRARGE